MCRCVGCNNPLKWIDLKLTKPDGSEEDLCSVCRDEVYNIDVPEHKSYMFEDLKEGLRPLNMEYLD